MWKATADQLKNYPYIKTEADIRAFNWYLSRGFGNYPPERPDGFLDEGEALTWARIVAKAEKAA